MDGEARYIVAVVVAIILLVVVLFAIHDGEGIEIYNNGICKQCGGCYSYQQTICSAYFRYYVYICDGCGNMIETGQYMGR